MEKIYTNILSLIISCVVTYSLIVPTIHIFGLEDSTSANGSVKPSESSQSPSTTEQTSTDSSLNVETTSESEPQKADDANSEKETTKQLDQTTKDSSSADTAPPGRVGAIFVKVVSDNQIDLKWTGIKDPDFNHYNVYLGTKSSFKLSPGVTVLSGTSNTNSYSSTGLDPSTTYYYKIAAVDDANNIGPLSNAKTGTTKGAATSTHDDSPSGKTTGPATSTHNDSPTQELSGMSSSSTMTISSADTNAPAQVTGLIVRTMSSTQLYLTWNRVTASDFNHYNIYRGTSGFTVTPGVTVPTGTSTTSSYSNTGLNPSTTYSYRVAAVDNAGNIGSLSSQVSKTTAASTTSPDKTPPGQVAGLIVSTTSSSQLHLAWTQVSASDFNHYNIYRGTSPNFAVALGITLPVGTSTANSYSNTGLNPSTTYYYKVSAVDNAGNIGALSTEKSASTAGTTSTGNVYDDFQGGTYKLTDGQKSPNGKWLSKWNAAGEMGVKTENGNNVFYGFPKTATSPGQTFSSFALSTQKFSDMTLELDMKTYKQLTTEQCPKFVGICMGDLEMDRFIPPLLLCA